MKTPSYQLVCLFMAGVWLVGSACTAAEASANDAPSETDIWQDALIHPFDAIVLTESQIDRFLERLSQTNPARAAELERSRITRPQQFRWEIREEMANRFFQRIQPPDEPAPAVEPTPTEPPAEPDAALRQKQAELIDWLEKNFPKQAKDLKADLPLTAERMDELRGRYDPMMRAERFNPPLAEAMKEDLRVQMRRDELLMELQLENPDKREAIVNELEQLVSKRFDLIIRKRELQHGHIRNRLNQLQEELDRQQKEINTLRNAKTHSVRARVEELIQSAEKTDWD